MTFEEQLSIYEKDRDWKSAVNLFNQTSNDNPGIALRVMFLLVDFLVDGINYTQEDHNLAAYQLKAMFNRTMQEYSNNHEFLFFMGIMIYIAEWYFGINDLNVANEMLAKASDMEPENNLYKWGFLSRIDQNFSKESKEKLILLEKLIFENKETINWLTSKGLIGEYILGNMDTSGNAPNIE